MDGPCAEDLGNLEWKRIPLSGDDLNLRRGIRWAIVGDILAYLSSNGPSITLSWMELVCKGSSFALLGQSKRVS